MVDFLYEFQRYCEKSKTFFFVPIQWNEKRDFYLQCATYPCVGRKCVNPCFIYLFIGELGWEFYVKNEQARDLYAAIMNAGQKHNIGFIGSYAINAMRLEKGFRLWGAEVNFIYKFFPYRKVTLI